MFEDLVQTLNFPSTDFTILAFFNILSISDSEFSFWEFWMNNVLVNTGPTFMEPVS